MFKKVYAKLKTDGTSGVFDAILRRIPSRRIACYSRSKRFIKDKSGLEIGGPSTIFSSTGLMPLYALANRIDNCNFSDQTIWEGHITEGDTFQFASGKRAGKQYVMEATALRGIESGRYDFVLSSHVLEHIANPLLALKEWIRVLKDGGLLVLILPHKDGTFDHKRTVTSLAHLVYDYEQGTDEADSTHLEEILQMHDLSLDPEAGHLEAFKARSMRNLENRCLHHHVFDTRLAVEMVNYMDLQILSVQACSPHNIVVVAQKPKSNSRLQNSSFRDVHAKPYRASPFPSDQK